MGAAIGVKVIGGGVGMSALIGFVIAVVKHWTGLVKDGAVAQIVLQRHLELLFAPMASPSN